MAQNIVYSSDLETVWDDTVTSRNKALSFPFQVWGQLMKEGFDQNELRYMHAIDNGREQDRFEAILSL